MTGEPIPIDLQEWSQRTATDKGSPLARIFLEDADARMLAQKLTTSGMLDIRELREGLSITSTSYAGRITLGNLLITIQPKISGMSLVRLLRIAQQNGVNQAALPCTYYPRLEDCLINQVLLQGLYLASHLTDDSRLRIKLYRLVNLFQDTVSLISLD
jgi:hypothetical protein